MGFVLSINQAHVQEFLTPFKLTATQDMKLQKLAVTDRPKPV